MAKLTPEEKAKVLVMVIFVGIPVGLLLIGFVIGLVNPRSPEQTQKDNQDSICRSLGRDGANAKTQAEYDYAKSKFAQSCADWTDSRQK